MGKNGRNGNGHGKLTVRQRKLLAAKLAGKSHRQAAKEAGYAPTTVENGSALTRPNVRAEFERLLEKYAPLEKVAQRVSEGLDAKETKFFAHEDEFADKNGVILKKHVIKHRNVIAWGERRRYAELVGRFRNLISFEGQPPGPAAINLIFYGVQPPTWANSPQELLPES